MKISLIGYGKMGREVERVAVDSGVEVYSVIYPSNRDAMYREITEENISGADVCIDFTSPDSVVPNVRKVAALRKNMVVGTTGWYDSLEEVEEIVRKSGIGLVYAPNFSLGMNVNNRMILSSGHILKKLGYEPRVIETHHANKVDKPSGTAKGIAHILKRQGFVDVPIESRREGDVVGIHTTVFDSPYDRLEITHVAKSREGFAKGVLEAARWVKDKRDLYTLDDMLDFWRLK